MQKPSPTTGAFIGALLSLPLLALFYLGQILAGLPFLPFDLFDWLARVSPGGLVTLGIDILVTIIRTLDLGPTDETAKLAEQIMAVLLFVLLEAGSGGLTAWLKRRTPYRGERIGLAFGVLLFLLAVAAQFGLKFSSSPLLLFIWLALLLVGGGFVLGRTLNELELPAEHGPEAQAGRRDFLLKFGGGALGLALSAWGLGRLLQPPDAEMQAEAGAGRPLDVPEPDLPAGLNERLQPAPDTRPELTSNDDFYRIDINTRPPLIDGPSWQLEIAGLFNRPGHITLEEILALPSVTVPITLGCISNPVGGDLISSSQWTGVRLAELLTGRGLQDAAQALYIEARDGFFEVVSLADMMDPRTLLVYAMNGESLLVEHGFPLRIYIPNRYGMKQPKWITRLEAINEDIDGYWVQRGWDKEAIPHTVSVIDNVAVEQAEQGMVPVGGIAWAGDRGIQKVEVRVDDGEWVEADLRQPTLSALTWVQWRYDWAAAPGRYTLTVRATDGNGTLQTAEETDVRWDGATGYHSLSVNI